MHSWGLWDDLWCRKVLLHKFVLIVLDFSLIFALWEILDPSTSFGPKWLFKENYLRSLEEKFLTDITQS